MVETKLTYQEAVKLELETIKSVEGKVSQNQIETTMARLGLDQDLGHLKNDWLTIYSLDDDTRDRLIAHTRQDAALAYYTAQNAKKAVQGLRNIVWFLGLTNIALLLVLVLR